MHVKFKLGNIEFEADGDSEFVERERREAISALESIVKGGALTGIVPLEPELNSTDCRLIDEGNLNSIAFSSFTKRIGAKSDLDKIIAAAYYLYYYRHQETFTSTDFNELLSKNHIKRPNNTSQAIINAVKQGVIEQTDGEPGDKAKRYRTLIAIEDWYQERTTALQK